MLLFLPPHLQSVLLFYPQPLPPDHKPYFLESASLPSPHINRHSCPLAPPCLRISLTKFRSFKSPPSIPWRSSGWDSALPLQRGNVHPGLGNQDPTCATGRQKKKKKAPSQQASHALAQAATFSASPGSPTLTRRDAAGMQDLARARELLRSGTRPALPSRASIPSPASRAVLTE